MKKIRIIFVLFILIFLLGIFGFARYISNSLADDHKESFDENSEQTSIYNGF